MKAMLDRSSGWHVGTAFGPCRSFYGTFEHSAFTPFIKRWLFSSLNTLRSSSDAEHHSPVFSPSVHTHPTRRFAMSHNGTALSELHIQQLSPQHTGTHTFTQHRRKSGTTPHTITFRHNMFASYLSPCTASPAVSRSPSLPFAKQVLTVRFEFSAAPRTSHPLSHVVAVPNRDSCRRG